MCRSRGNDLFAANCNAHCVLVNGDPAHRIGKKIRRRPGAKLVTLLSGDELFPIGERVKPFKSPWVGTLICTFHRWPYIQDREAMRCRVDECFRNGVALTWPVSSTMRCQHRIGKALISLSETAGASDSNNMPILRGPVHVLSVTNSMRPSQNSLHPTGPGISSAEEAACFADALHRQVNHQNVFASSCWQKAPLPENGVPCLPVKPSIAKLGCTRPFPREATPQLPMSQSSGPNVFGRVVDLTGSSGRLLSSIGRRDGSDLNQSMPSSVRQPREGVRPDTYPFETPSFAHPPIASDHSELTMERMGDNAA